MNRDRFIRLGTNNPPRPMGSGLSGRAVRPMGPGGGAARDLIASVTAAGVVTVYDVFGNVRWSADLLTQTVSLGHDISFDDVGGIWARSGNGLQLVHTDTLGNVLTDTAVGSAYSGGSQLPAIANSAAGLCYKNQLSVAGLAAPAILAHGPTGDLLGSAFIAATPERIGITTSGVVASFGNNYYIWDATGTLLFFGSALSIATGVSAISAACISPTGDFIHVFGYSTFYSSVYRGTVSLSTGVVGGGTDTLLPAVTAAWCNPSGTALFGATSVAQLPASSYGQLDKLDGGTTRVVTCADGAIELWTFALGSYSLTWTKADSATSCAYYSA